MKQRKREHMHGVFDIVGPVMIGPSSSHTAGAVRLGLMARKVLGEPAVRADINLHGSFAQTYRGHGTDKALIAGILGFAPDDERIRDAVRVAVPDTAAATRLILAHPEMFTDYEITKGRMDDVFLAVTGKKLNGGGAE